MIDFSLSFREIIDLYGNNPFSTFKFLMKHGGFIILYPFLVKGLIDGWLQYIQNRVKYTRNYVLMAINVPKEDEQSMKAVEQMFAHMYGTKDTPRFTDKWWNGWTQEIFSLEIESNGGYIQFYIRCVDYHQDIVEAAIYAQYPDAEITTVDPDNDYKHIINEQKLLDKTYDLYGAEFVLDMPDIYCIRHWRGWEHQMPGKFIDPMAALLEIMSRIQPGEHLWFQIMAQPDDLPPLSKQCQAEIDKYTGDQKKKGGDWWDFFIDWPIAVLGIFHDAVFGGAESAEAAKEDAFGRRIFLVDWEREAVTELDMKRSRWPFKSKVRFAYFAPPEKYQEEKGRRGFVGAMKQFKFLNNFSEGRWTQVSLDNSYWFDTYWQPLRQRRRFWRKRRLVWNFKAMDMDRGEHGGLRLTVEELASLFHFPQIDVRAPFIRKAESRRVEPPTQLTFVGDPGEALPPNVSVQPEAQVAAGEDQDRMPSPVPHPDDIPKPTNLRINYTPEQLAHFEKLEAERGIDPATTSVVDTLRQSPVNQYAQPQVEMAPETQSAQPAQTPVQPQVEIQEESVHEPGGPPSNLPIA